MNELRRDEYGVVTTLPNGRTAEVVPLIFHRARICLVNQHCRITYDDVW